MVEGSPLGQLKLRGFFFFCPSHGLHFFLNVVSLMSLVIEATGHSRLPEDAGLPFRNRFKILASFSPQV